MQMLAKPLRDAWAVNKKWHDVILGCWDQSGCLSVCTRIKQHTLSLLSLSLSRLFSVSSSHRHECVVPFRRLAKITSEDGSKTTYCDGSSFDFPVRTLLLSPSLCVRRRWLLPRMLTCKLLQCLSKTKHHFHNAGGGGVDTGYHNKTRVSRAAC